MAPLATAARLAVRLLSAKRTGLSLILAMGAYALIGTVLAQAPASARVDATAYVTWVESVRPRYGVLTSLFAAWGFFHAFSSVGFLVVCALTVASIIAATLRRIPGLWRAAARPQVVATDALLERARHRAHLRVDASPSEVMDVVRRVLASRRYRVLTPSPMHLYADRFRWCPLGTVLSHAGFVLIIVGIAVTATAGFRDEERAFTVGTTAGVGHGTGLQLAARSFTDRYHPDGRPMDFASEVALLRDGAEVARQVVRVNEPLRYDGLSIYQATYGTAAVIDVTDASGGVVYDSGVPLQWSMDGGAKAVGTATVAPGRILYVVTAANGHTDPALPAGTARVFLYRTLSEQPLGTALIEMGRSATIDGLTFTFARERAFTGLTIARDPGAPLVWVAAALMLIGLFSALYLRPRQLWVRLRADDHGTLVELAAPARRSGPSGAFEHLLAQLETELPTRPVDADPPAAPGGAESVTSHQSGLIHA